MARPPFTFARNTLGSNGSFALRFIADPPLRRGSFEERTPFYSIAPRRDNPLAAAVVDQWREAQSSRRSARPSATPSWSRTARLTRWRARFRTHRRPQRHAQRKIGAGAPRVVPCELGLHAWSARVFNFAQTRREILLKSMRRVSTSPAGNIGRVRADADHIPGANS
jgi:hypothetical protein